MATTSRGDPAPKLTREDLHRLQAVMLAAEPDWASRCALLASSLQTATLQLADEGLHARLQTVVNDYYRDLADWQNAADAYYQAVGGPVADSIAFDDEVG